MKKPIFIGIAGGTGSGKSTFTNRLKETFGDKVSVVYYDNYYKRRDDLPFEERKKINYDQTRGRDSRGGNHGASER